MTFRVVPGNSGTPQSKTIAPAAQGKDALSQGPKARVLIVDDEPSICKALTMALARAGYDAFSAVTGETALAIVRSEQVDVMLIDLRIPDMRGDVIFEVAAGHQPHLRYQTLFMTGDITERAQRLITACGCNFLRKPFDLGDMMNAVAALSPRQEQQDAG